ncbi:MAG: MaoC family dehydratase [Rhodospirillaceae bacterium]|jgi:itaconyl-CoA hydratase|nr:MaoC family dehydratase [Rhodospirillaceae bacterium]MBT5565914.1 MaoC family dehydratase [Rhodospirillaceae bacterium]MBT6088666.1 MaoC family dehydratase [Rhodospirillaceae bacterium]MBT6961140.1 MaoC family dehydratase [Rhodospirillaceae bacterium]MBT7451040.1 MaoC family dehydratase [Rhodospirillaceae bacterium]
MVVEAAKVGENRYRERGGRYFEDFKVGDIYEHRPGRTVTLTDNIWFTTLTMNTHPVHFDAEYAKHTEFGQPLIVSTLTLAIITGMSVSDISQKAIANLGWTDIMLPHPVYADDTIYAESEVLSTRPSKSRPGQGIVKVKTMGFNQKHDIICTYERTVLVMGRDNNVEDAAGY